jgi:molybdopterin-synthase adenylyltransferase
MTTDRYSRQVRFAGIGEDGQERLAAGRAVLIGCGALGTVIANHLVRAGVGFLRIIDRDFIETHNLQRQTLFDEKDVEEGWPKSEAAARKLQQVNSTVTIEPIVTDVDRTNVLDLVGDCDVILDGSDNFEVRYLINDAAVKLSKPWIYGGCIGSLGETITIIPGETSCLRCVFEEAPGPGETATCETAGVLGPAVAVIASIQSTEALKLLAGRREANQRNLLYIDVWDNLYRSIQIAAIRDRVDCRCCKQKQFDWLDGKFGATTTTLCGRNAVQVSHRTSTPLQLDELAKQLAPLGTVSANKFLLRFERGEHTLVVFPDGRAIIQGTADPDKARALYAQYIGH